MPDFGSGPTESLVEGANFPDFIGDFRVLRRIGEGGMGVVFEAEQQHPKRLVALKVIRAGRWADEHVVRLFRREIQALARLRHPGVAAIYDSGCTADGHHFYAMELVRGEPLHAWLAARRRSPEEPDERNLRLGVFLHLCDAVLYAHQRAVIHRDLKPANVLVLPPPSGPVSTGDDGEAPPVKVLDFGLAKITEADVAATTMVTEAGRVQGTLAYMSPEQLRGNPDEIDLRSDVYALGAILFEMFAGVPPREATSSRGHPDPKRLPRDLRIVMAKALEEEPSRRYPSVAVLGEDVRRFLQGQPVLAHPPSAAYQIRRLIARHKLPFVLAAGAIALIAGAAAVLSVQAKRLADARDAARLESDAHATTASFLIDLFRVGVAGKEALIAREILDRGEAQVTRDYAGRPLLEAKLLHTLGLANMRLGANAKAVELHERALALRRAALDPDSRELAESWLRVGGARHSLGDARGACAALEEAWRLYRKLDGPEAETTVEVEAALGFNYRRMNRNDEALPFLRHVLEANERRYGPDALEVVGPLQGLAPALATAGLQDEAIAMAERAREIRVRRYPPGDPRIDDNHTLVVLLSPRDPRRAIELAERMVASVEQRFGAEDPATADALIQLAGLRARLGQFAEADRLHRRAIGIMERSGELGSVVAVYNHACVYALCRKPDEAFALLDRVVASGYALTTVLDDPDLANLRDDPRWAIFAAGIRTNAARAAPASGR